MGMGVRANGFLLYLVTTVLVLLSVHGAPGWAQSTRTPALIADSVSYDADLDALVAKGSVEIYFEGGVLRATELTFYNQTSILEAVGPLVLETNDDAVIIADFASLDGTLKSGLIQGARLVLAQNFQLAAAQAQKLGDRFTVLEKTIASSCQVCQSNPTPLWLIRADRIIRDLEEQKLHFENARFEVFGVTVAYLPYFRIPDPSVKRATGILQPEYKSSEIFGIGFKIPYFIVINDHADVTITPFITSKGPSILEGEYRRRHVSGGFNLRGATTVDQQTSQLRGFIFADGSYALPKGFRFSFDIERAGDKQFLREFGYSTTDRLKSTAVVSRQKGNEYIAIDATSYQTLRLSEDDRAIPLVVPQVSYSRYWDEETAGGRIDIHASTVGLTRQLGRDVFRLGGGASWSKGFELPVGIQARMRAGIDSWFYTTRDDPNFASGVQSVFVPRTGVELRWPLGKRTERASHILEPVAQLVFGRAYGDTVNVPNEDSVDVEFDASNLFDFERFPGADIVEEGWRMNVGANYTMIDDRGWNVGFTVGQVLRPSVISQFADATGLNNTQSNFVAAANLNFAPHFSLSTQTLFDSDFSFERNDVQASARFGKFTFGANYVYLLPDPSALSFQKRQELLWSTSYRPNGNWTLSSTVRRDLVQDRNVDAKFGILFGNECIETDFSVSRRFSNSNTIPSSTEYGLSVSLAGLGGGSKKWPAHKCSGR